MGFVGRERELALLAESIQRAASGQHARVVLTGPPGIGCTRLLDELLRRVSSIPGVVAGRGRALEPAAGVPYQAFGDAVAAALDGLDAPALGRVLGPAAHDASRLVPGLAERLDALRIDRAPPRLEAPEQLGKRVVESVLGLLERLAGDGVVVLVLEDLHWADPATRAFVSTLLGIGRPLPIALMLSYQPDELHRRHPMRPLADALRDDAATVRLELAPLSASEIERVIEDARGGRPSGGVLGAVVEGARGNPLVALQLADTAAGLDRVPLSDPFEQICAARLEALPAGAVHVVRLLAAARQPIARAVLLSLRRTDGRITVADVGAAVASGLVRDVDGAGDRGAGEQPGRPPEARLSVAHELYAEAIELVELPIERQTLHAALADRPGIHPAVAAWHLELAGLLTEARAAHLEAARLATLVDPAETSLVHVLRGLELPAAPGADALERSDLLVVAARASAAMGSERRAALLIRRAIAERASAAAPAARRGPRSSEALAGLHEQLARFEWAGGDLDTAIATLEGVIAMLPERPSRVHARVLASLGQFLMIAGRFDESLAVAERGRAVARAVSSDRGEALAELGHATCTVGVDVAYQGDLERGLGLLEEAAVLARRAGRLDDLMRVAANRTTLLDLDGRREEALAVVHEGIADAASGGLSATYGAFLRGNAADILFQLGRWPEAERECRAAMEWRPAGLAWFSPLLYLGLLLAEMRADDEAASLVGQSLLQLENVPAGQLTALLNRAAVSLALWRGEPMDALAASERDWERVLETDDLTQIALLASTGMEAAAAAAAAGRADHDWGMVAAARDFADRVVPEAERRMAGGALAAARVARKEAALHLATARAHRGRLRGAGDPDAWAHLARAWRTRSMPYPSAKALWWQGLAILESGALGEEPTESEREAARAAARAPLSEAWAIAARLPALPLMRVIADLATRARVPLPAGVTPQVAPAGATHEPVPAGLEGVAAVAIPVGRLLVPVGPGPGAGTGEGTPPDLVRRIEEDVLAGLRSGAGDAFGLTPREREVLAVLVEGRTDRDIAARLFISERTVHVHVRRILAKLGVASRTEATGVAIRQGLVSVDALPVATGRRGRDGVASGP